MDTDTDTDTDDCDRSEDANDEDDASDADVTVDDGCLGLISMQCFISVGGGRCSYILRCSCSCGCYQSYEFDRP